MRTKCRAGGNHLLTPQELMDMYDQVERGGGGGGRQSHDRGSWEEEEGLLNEHAQQPQYHSEGGEEVEGGGLGKPMRRYIAITVVEIVFVLAESFFWQVSERLSI